MDDKYLVITGLEKGQPLVYGRDVRITQQDQYGTIQTTVGQLREHSMDYSSYSGTEYAFTVGSYTIEINVEEDEYNIMNGNHELVSTYSNVRCLTKTLVEFL